MYGNLYVITNTVNNHKYIGKTYNTLKQRFSNHITDSGDVENRNRPLYKEMRKYGYINFKIERIGIFKDGILEEKEIEFIAQYKKAGYVMMNDTDGGEGFMIADKNTERECIKLYIKNELSVHAIADKLAVSKNTVAKILRNNYIFCDNISKIRNEITNFIRVRMLDKVSGNEIKVFESIKEAGNYLGVNDPSHISKVCRGKRPSAFGYKWKYI